MAKPGMASREQRAEDLSIEERRATEGQDVEADTDDEGVTTAGGR
jgi:hypothetical protein